MTIYFLAHRINNPTTGGEYYNEALLKGAQNAGFVVMRWEATKYDFIKFLPIKIIILNIVFLFKSLSIKKKSIFVYDTDYHLFYFASIWITKYFKKAKIVGMLHLYYYLMNDNSIKNKIHLYTEKSISKKFDYLITNSKFSLTSFEKLTNKRIPYSIHSPFSIEKKEKQTHTTNYDPACLRILQIGTIEARKNLKSTILAVSKLQIPFTLDFVGQPVSEEYLTEMQQLTKTLNISDRVFFRGKANRTQINEYYLKSTLFILPSKLETYGMVYAEAMQYGLPIIASDNGAIPELIEHGVNGYLCKYNDIDAISSYIEKCFQKDTWFKIHKNNLEKSNLLIDKDTFISKSQTILKQLTLFS